MIEHFYNKTYGIYGPGFDRFILTDNKDIWVTMQTAELLSSKLPTVMFIMPKSELVNPTDYSLLNKLQYKIGPASISIARQYPQMKYIKKAEEIVYSGLAIDYTVEQIEHLKEFANYVHKLSYAIKFTETLYNPYDNTTFISNYIGLENIEELSHSTDRSNNDVFKLIRHAIYLSKTIEEINQQLIQIWLDNHTDQGYLITSFYSLIGKPVPDVLLDAIGQTMPKNLSVYIV